MRHSVHAASRESAGPHSRRSQYRLPVLLETTTENWEPQILPSSALSGKIKSWFKHQPKLDRFRLMIVFAARTGEHIEEANNVHPAVQADSCSHLWVSPTYSIDLLGFWPLHVASDLHSSWCSRKKDDGSGPQLQVQHSQDTWALRCEHQVLEA